MTFQPVEEALREEFLPAFFKGDTSQIPERAVTGLLVNQVGIALLEPNQTAGANWEMSCIITGYHVVTLCGTAKFRPGNHSLLMQEGRDEICQRHSEAVEMALGESRASAYTEDAPQMGHITRTWAWLSVIPSTVNGMEVGVQE